jgi:fatty-acyl-CoA synthase
MIQSLMQDVPLTLNLVREHVESLYSTKIVTTRFPGTLVGATYGEVLKRASRLAAALAELGVRQGDRVATLAWNTQHHLELYLAVPCMGAVLHTINARLPAETIVLLLAQAEDRVLFADRSLLARLDGVTLPTCVRLVVAIDDRADDAPSGDGAAVDYETLLADSLPAFTWPELDERQASGLCYTSGTTGAPKGVLYSHRSTVLHTMACLFADGIAMRERDVCMPVVPMFHANAWGFPYAALLAGASLALPCRQTDPESLAALIEGAGVTMATAVPTVWLDVLDALRSGRLSRERIATLRRIPMGGAAVSEALIAGFAAFGIEVTHCWGMTEISPLGLVNVPKSALDAAEAAASRSAQGLPIPGCAVRLADETGAEKPRDGMTAGELQIRSPWAADGYFDAAAPGNRLQEEAGGTSAFATDGRGRRWLRTGDIATIDRHGYVRLVDRAKDLIKSGGEWISSQALEGRILEHSDILEAAVVGRPDPKWQERPVAFVALRQGRDRNDAELETELHAALAVHFAKWQLPDAVVVLPILPKGNTGKINKAALRLDAKRR